MTPNKKEAYSASSLLTAYIIVLARLIFMPSSLLNFSDNLATLSKSSVLSCTVLKLDILNLVELVSKLFLREVVLCTERGRTHFMRTPSQPVVATSTVCYLAGAFARFRVIERYLATTVLYVVTDNYCTNFVKSLYELHRFLLKVNCLIVNVRFSATSIVARRIHNVNIIYV